MMRERYMALKGVNRVRRDIFARLMALVLALGLFVGVGTPALAKTNDGKTFLVFTSDVHNKDGNVSRNRMDKWIDTICDTYGGQIDYLGLCGDMGDAQVTESQFWSLSEQVMKVIDEKVGQGKIASDETGAVKTGRFCYTTGNHEFSPGNFDRTTNTVKNNYTIDSAAPSVPADANYYLYCMGSLNNNQSGEGYTTDSQNLGQVEKLDAFLDTCGTDKPIFVMTHFPLHRFSNRTTANAYKVIEVLNDAAKQGKTVVFLWGHNHSQRDGNYDTIFTPDTTISYSNSGSTKFNFYYLAAGCMSDYEYYNSDSVKGKGLVVTIDDATDAMSFTYYNESGVTVASLTTEGTAAPVTKHTITWKDDDGSILSTAEVDPDTVPTYPYAMPTKPADDQFTYSFAGWTPKVVPASADATYTATYTATPLAVSATWERLSGTGRYDTMSAIVSAGFKKSTVAVLATGKDYPDALVAASMAGALDCPIILTQPAELSQQAIAQLEGLDVEEVYVIGGESAVSAKIWTQLEGMDIVTHRISGSSRLGTSLEAMKQIEKMGKFYGTVVIATGYNFADALSIGPWCYKTATPILLANKAGKLSEAQVEAARQLGVKSLIIVGGTGAVSNEVFSQLKIDEEDSGSARLAGKNRYETSHDIAMWELAERGMTMANVAVATGAKFPDALAGAALCGHNNSVLILAKNEKSAGLGLISKDSGVQTGYALGGTSAVSDSLFAYLQTLTA